MNLSLYCNDKYIKTGGRKSVNLSLDEFKQKVIKKFGDPNDSDEDNLKLAIFNRFNNETIMNDLGKVIFNDENITATPNEFIDNGGKLLGYHHINGLSFLGGLAGGDWETPVFFIIYYDGKKFRGYVPTAGNVFNIKFKTAFGSEQEAEIEGMEEISCEDEFKFIINKTKELYKEQFNLTDEQLEEWFDENGQTQEVNFQYDWDWIEKDIVNRIQII